MIAKSQIGQIYIEHHTQGTTQHVWKTRQCSVLLEGRLIFICFAEKTLASEVPSQVILLNCVTLHLANANTQNLAYFLGEAGIHGHIVNALNNQYL